MRPITNALHAPDSAAMSELWSHVVAHAPIIVWKIDLEGKFTLSMGRALGTLGLQPGEVVGQSVFEIYADNPAVLDMIRDTLQGGEHQFLADLGGVYFDSWMRPLYDDDGGICGAFGVASDATRRERAVQLQRHSSENFLKAFHASPAGILLTELETGRILDVNSALCQLTGYQRADVIGRTTLDVGFWPDAETRHRSMQASLAGQGPSRFRYRIKLPTGKRLDVTIVVEMVEIEGEACALTIIRDNRAERRIRRALGRTRRRYRTLAKFAPVGIFQANALGEVTYVNEEACRLLSRPRTTLKGQGWWSAVAAEDLETLRALWQEKVALREPFTTEFRVLRSEEFGTRELIWVQLQLEPETEASGFIGALTDIDRRKRAEVELQLANLRLEENVRLRTELLTRTAKTLEQQIFERRRTFEHLEKSEERWRALVARAPDVIMLIERNGAIEYINHTALRPQLGVENVVGRTVFDFAYERFHAGIHDVLRQVFEEGRSLTHEAAGPGDAGEDRCFQSHLAPIWHNGKVIGSTVIVRDVTEERRAQAELRQTQDLLVHAGRVSTVGEMMAGFAHELGQPLFAISTYIEGCLIRLDREVSVPADVLQVMRDAIEQSHRAIAVVRRLREYLRRQDIQREVHDLNQIVQDAVELASVGVAKNDAVCQVELFPQNLEVVVDRIQVMQVLVNLILNAAESMAAVHPPKPTVTIRTGRTADEKFTCSVSDNGPGIPQSVMDQIFDPFFTTKDKGLGLGLSISRSIIEAHGGTIQASQAAEGTGALFLIQLPGQTGE